MSKKVLFIVVISTLLASCIDLRYTTDPDKVLEYSTERLSMDTAFGSSQTWSFIVYNRNSKALMIDKIELRGGRESSFMVNIDGRRMDSEEGLEMVTIMAKDSLIVRVQCVNKGNEDFMLLTDTVTFACNGRVDSVALEMTGRQAVRMDNYQAAGDMVMEEGLPYLVTGYLYVPEGARLTVREGTEIYLHKGANIIVDGEISIEGTAEKRVLIRGDRFDAARDGGLEIPYYNIPGQWGGIYLQNAHARNSIKWAEIRGMTSGIIVLGAGRATPELVMENCRVHCSGGYGVYAQLGDVEIRNSEISNCGQSCVVAIGGAITIQQSTIADYYTFATRKTAAVRVFNYAESYGRKTHYPVERMVIENSVIFGSLNTEIETGIDSTATFNAWVSHSLVKASESSDAGKRERGRSFYRESRWDDGGKDVFVNVRTDYEKDSVEYYDFRLGEESVGRGMADENVARMYNVGLDGVAREDYTNIGAY